MPYPDNMNWEAFDALHGADDPEPEVKGYYFHMDNCVFWTGSEWKDNFLNPRVCYYDTVKQARLSLSDALKEAADWMLDGEEDVAAISLAEKYEVDPWASNDDSRDIATYKLEFKGETV